jgi:hypothetical protein
VIRSKLIALGIAPLDGDGYAFLASVYRNPSLPIELRLAAAKAAVSFEKPRLATRKLRIKAPQDMPDDEPAAALAVAKAIAGEPRTAA